jgi:hypothetical protein
MRTQRQQRDGELRESGTMVLAKNFDCIRKAVDVLQAFQLRGMELLRFLCPLCS